MAYSVIAAAEGLVSPMRLESSLWDVLSKDGLCPPTERRVLDAT